MNRKIMQHLHMGIPIYTIFGHNKNKLKKSEKKKT